MHSSFHRSLIPSVLHPFHRSLIPSVLHLSASILLLTFAGVGTASLVLAYAAQPENAAPPTSQTTLSIADAAATGVKLQPIEAEILAEFGTLTALGQELRELRSIPFVDRSPQQQERIEELLRVQQGLQQEFQDFIHSPEIQEAVENLRPSSSAIALDNLTRMQDNLQALEQNAVLLYPLILDDRLELVLVTADAPPIRRSVSVSRAELHQAIADFRQTLESPQSNPKPVAQQLYQWLIQPFDAELAAANTEAILYSPDGPLRYIPLAALHTGDQWLVEQYTVNNMTTASLTDLDNSPQSPPRILAAAHTEGRHDVTIDDRTLSFNGFPGAKAEVEAIATLFPNTTVLFNEDFNADIISTMNEYSILHFATNALFSPEGPDESFILLGNGDRVTLADIKNWNLSGVDLVVLSACETGLGGFDSNATGEEILGFGYVVEQAGARGAIASLWLVHDQGTAVLMEEFYQGIQQNVPYAEALQQAQVALIEGESGVENSVRGIGLDGITPGPSSRDLSHPYYWAPFILIGNGL